MNMKRKNKRYLAIAGVVALVACFLTLNFKAKEAGIINLPDFTKVQDETTAKDMSVNTLADLNKALTKIVDQTVPSVVTLKVSEEVTVKRPSMPPMFQRFFGRQAPSQPEKYTRRGLGSGVIVSEDGYILTNNHVVAGAEQIIVTMHNGREYEGKVVGRDPMTDIAVVKIDAEGLNPIPIGNSDKLDVGEMVLAIGSPLGDKLAHTVTFGIVSAKGRTLGPAGSYNMFIQTDAAINPGNSGGPLVNMSGQLVGINSAIISKTGGYQGIGLAIPSNIAKNIMRSIIEDGEVERAYLGVYRGGVVDATMARALKVDINHGVIVSKVAEDSPAQEAGMQKGDIIYKVNGEPIDSFAELATIIGTKSPGTEVNMSIVRDGERIETTVTLAQREGVENSSTTTKQRKDIQKSIGFNINNLKPELAQRLGLEPNQTGVVVTNIERTSNAYRQGLRKGDIIVGVSKQPIEGVSDFVEAMRAAKSEEEVALLQVLRPARGRDGIAITRLYIAFEM